MKESPVMEMHRRHRSTYKGDRAQIMALPDPTVCALVRERAALLNVPVVQYAGDVLSEHVGLDHLVRELHGLDLGILPPAVPDMERASYVEALEAPSFVKALLRVRSTTWSGPALRCSASPWAATSVMCCASTSACPS